MTTEPVTPRRDDRHFSGRVRPWARVFTAPAERTKQVNMAFVEHDHIWPVLIQVSLQSDEIGHNDVAWDPRVDDLYGVSRRELRQPELESGRPGRRVAADPRVEGGRGPDRHDAYHARRLLDGNLGTAKALAVNVNAAGVIKIPNQRVPKLAVLVEQQGHRSGQARPALL